MLNEGLMSSTKDYLETPQKFFDELNKEFKFNLDVASTHENAKTDKRFTKEGDGLSKSWAGNVFCNPPYENEISMWVKKAYEESLTNDGVIVLLIPARTDTRYWHDYI